MCKWRAMHANNGRTPRRNMREPYWWSISHMKGHSCRILWPTMREDCTRYAQQCKQCQQHADWHKAPPEEPKSIYSPWLFNTWGIDILGPFPLAVRQMMYLVVTIEYFTKWIEAEPVAQITTHKIQHFVWKNIVCRFGVPKQLVSANGT